MISSQPASPVQRIFVGLFFSVFLAMGGAFFYFTVLQPFFQSTAARHWVETPCRVLSSEVKYHSGSKGGTYSEEIAYAYQVDGREYHSDRYQFLRFSSSGRQAKANVVAKYPRGRQAVCYVNPKSPSEAVLDRGFAPVGWFAFFPLVFVGIGMVGLVGAVRGRGIFVGQGYAVNAGTNAAEAWRQRPDWAAGRVVSSGKKQIVGVWFFAGFWNLISTTVAWNIIGNHAIHKGNEMAAVVLIFPLVGLGLLIWALRMTLRWMRFGESVFEMASVPGLLGGALEGVICPSCPMRPEGPIQLRLNCLSRVTRSSGNGSSTQENLLWQHETAVEMCPDGTIPVAFYLPADGSETSVIGVGNGVLWRLEVKARVPGVDYVAQFEVPVFQGEQTPEQQAEAAKLIAHEQAEVAAYVQPPTSRIRVGMSLRGGMEFVFPPCRNPGSALFLTVIAAVFAGVVLLIVKQHGPMPARFIVGFLDLILIYAAVYSWTHSTRIEVTPEAVSVTQSTLGISRCRTVMASEIAEIKTKIGMTSGTNVYHDLKLVLRDESEIAAGSAIKDAREAEWLTSEMTKALKRQ